MNDRLAREVEALLRGDFRGPLAPGVPRAPVLGSRSHAGRAARVAAPPPPPPVIFGADHGLLYAASVGAAEQATVWAYDELIAYLRSNAITLSEVCGRSFPNSYGSGNDNSYPSSVWGSAGVGERRTVPPVAVPHLHSGLGVLWAQGMVGAGRDITTLAGLAYSPAECTVVRSPSGDYWLISTPACGDWTATRLAVGGGLECAEASVRGGDVDGVAADVLQSLVLGRLVLADPSYSVTIATWAADLAPLFEVPMEYYWAGAPADVWEWGWQWSNQCAGASDEFIARAVIVLLNEVWLSASYATDRRVCSRECTAVLQWDEAGVPVGVDITVGADELFVLPSAIIELIGTSGASLPYINAVVDGPDIFGPGGTLAVWFKPNGEMARVRWDGMSRFETVPRTSFSISLIGYGTASGSGSIGQIGGVGKAVVDGIEFSSQHSARKCTLVYTYSVAQESGVTSYDWCSHYVDGERVFATWYSEESANYTITETETVEVKNHIKTYLLFGSPRNVWACRKEITSRITGEKVIENGAAIKGTVTILETPCTPTGNTPGVYVKDYSHLVNYPNYGGAIGDTVAATTQPDVPSVGTLIPGSAAYAYGPVGVTINTSGGGVYSSSNVGAVACSYLGKWVASIGSAIITPASIPSTALSDVSDWIWVGGA